MLWFVMDKSRSLSERASLASIWAPRLSGTVVFVKQMKLMIVFCCYFCFHVFQLADKLEYFDAFFVCEGFFFLSHKQHLAQLPNSKQVTGLTLLCFVAGSCASNVLEWAEITSGWVLDEKLWLKKNKIYRLVTHSKEHATVFIRQRFQHLPSLCFQWSQESRELCTKRLT